LETYLGKVKSEERPSKRKRSKIEGRVWSGGRGERRKRRSVVAVLEFEENYVIPVDENPLSIVHRMQ
jgi:hypothetical protein